MAIHGKQLKSASIDLTKLEGISTAPGADKLLLSAASGALQALTLDGDLSQTISGSTISLHLKNGVIAITDLADGTIVDESEGIGSNDNDTTIPTSAAVKDYVDTQVTVQDLDLAGDSGTGAVDLDSQSLTIAGGTGLSSTAANQTVTLAIDATVATLTGSQTLTNKTLTSAVLNTGVSGTAIKDEDDMALSLIHI